MGESGDFSLLDFEACFKQHKDTDEGLVTKPEMVTFIKKVVGLNVDEEPFDEELEGMGGTEPSVAESKK